MQQVKKFFIVAVICFAVVSCECYNKCSGHGTCDSSNRCICHKQLGLGLNEAEFNASMYTGADCSERMCPTGVAFTPAVDEEEYYEVVDVKSGGGSPRELFDDRELADTDADGTETPGDEERPETPKPTPSIDEILDKITDLNKTTLDKPVEVFKPKASNTPSLGGAMRCEDGKGNIVYVSVSAQVGDTIVGDSTEGLENCKVTYVRKDLSLSGVIDFDKGRTATWDNGEEMRLYGFQYNTTYDVNVACINDESLAIKEESNKVTLFNKEDGDVIFTYNKAKKETYPMFCYLLTVGVDSDSKVQNIELLSSELADMVGKSSEGLVFGQNIDNGAVVVMEGKDVIPKSGAGPRERMLADDSSKTPVPVILNLNKQFNPAKPNVTDNDKDEKDENTRILADPSSSAVAGNAFGGYKKYLQVGNKVFIRVMNLKTGKFLPPQTMYLAAETQTCKQYCNPDPSSKCSMDADDAKKDGCFVIFLNEEINGEDDNSIADDDTIYFTLKAVGIHPTSECSGVGKCNRQTGQCECLPGYTGDACQILSCPNDCSNHGRCVKSSQTIFDGSTTFVQSVPNMFGYSKESKQKVYGCICDEGYRGPDCSLIECPSDKDPSGGSNDDTKPNGQFRDCSGRGICDYKTGNCNCFDGFFGTACETALGSI